MVTGFFEKFNRATPTEEDISVSAEMTDYRLNVYKEEKIVNCFAVFKKIISQKALNHIEITVKDAYGLTDFRIFPTFENAVFTKDYVSELVELLEEYGVKAYTKGFMSEYKTEYADGELKITLADGYDADFLTDRKIDDFFEKAISERFGITVKVRFIGEGRLDVFAAAERKLEEELKKSPPSHTEREPVVGCDNRSYDPLEGKLYEEDETGTVIRSGRLSFDISEPKLFFGSEATSKFAPIRELAEGKKKSFLCRMFQSEEKENREGTLINYTLNVTDLDSSIIVRVTAEKAKELKMPDPGTAMLVTGTPYKDKFDGEIKVKAAGIQLVKEKKSVDKAEETRVELHLHTTLSANDALCDPTDVIETAKRWGMPAIAVTDHGNVQAFPIVMAATDKIPDVKPIYGMEGYLVDDTARAVFEYKAENDCSFKDGVFTVFDIETTGLSPSTCGITEIGAIRYKGGEVLEVFETFVNPGMPIPEKITELTGITDEMVKDAPNQKEAVESFLKFAEGTILVAHNASFDTGFIRKVALDNKIPFVNPYLDTVALSRYLNPELSKHNLEAVRKYYKLGEFNHHRASDDSKMLAEILTCMIKKMEPDGISTIGQMINEMAAKSDPRKLDIYHVSILVKTQAGMKNLYKIISASYLDYYYRYPRIPKTLIEQYREGLIIGSACESGEIYKSVLENKPYSDQMKAADFYDYFEIMPHSNNGFLIDEGKVNGREDLERINRRILEIADKQKKPCVATGDVHFMTEDDEVYRQILKYGQKYSDAFRKTSMYLKTTGEMLEEFAYLGDRAYEVVVTNTRKIADMIESGIRPIPKGNYPPSIDGAEEELTTCCHEKAKRLYGDPLPDVVQKRMDKELNSIIEHGFAVLYIIARKLVQNSESHGYLVGSRGSVGSSVIAFLADISEVNPLPPHYYCPKCRHSEFFLNGEYGSGFDMDDKNCPECGTKMICDGHNIPFETFLGFKGDKSPDIDLNFSGKVQGEAHKYTEVLFGKENIYRAGTVGTIASKTAYGYVMKYLEESKKHLSKAEINRLTYGCTGVKRTTGQHPGGIIVIPKDKEVYDFTPIQHPAEKEESGVITTHFAFVYLHDTILKLDMLGHDVPTIYKVLQDYTGINVLSVPMNDKNVFSLFTSPKALGVTPEEIDCETGTLTLPEMGTPYVRGMMMSAKPKNFSDLLQISGLSHGTGIWLGNGEELIKAGTCTIDTIIGTRDSIMIYLLSKNLEPSSAFNIMEKVRKGKGVSEEFEKEMLAHDVPQWYIDSCRKIKYMFPKAHAAAYVISALRLAWFKIYHPVEYYAAYFTARPDGIDAALVTQPKDEIVKQMKAISAKQDASQKEEDVYTCLQVVNEMNARGIKFLPINIFKSTADAFVPEDGNIRLPFLSMNGLGGTAAQSIYEAMQNGVTTIEELRTESGVSGTIIDTLMQSGALEGLPESSQLTLF